MPWLPTSSLTSKSPTPPSTRSTGSACPPPSPSTAASSSSVAAPSSSSRAAGSPPGWCSSSFPASSRPSAGTTPRNTASPRPYASRLPERTWSWLTARWIMGRSLSAAALAQYARDGYIFPVPVLSTDEARQYRLRVERVEGELGGPLRGYYRVKPHLLFTWLADLVRHPAILDAVEDVLGPDLLCWNTSFFTKEAQSPGFVSWHQDATYWGLSEPDVLTAWIAFTDSTPANGNMRVIPGSHRAQ